MKTVLTAVLRIACAALVGMGAASAQPFPSKPVRIVVANAPGSQADLLARILAQELGKQWPQPVLVENRPGASGFIAAEYTAKSAPDGHTLMLGSSGVMVINSHVYTKLPYDALKDFTIVSDVGSSPSVLVVSTASGVTNVRGLVEKSHKAGKSLSYGSLGGGSTHNIAAQLFGRAAKVGVMHVPYKSEPQIITDLISGNLDFAVLPMASTMSFIKANSLVPLAVSAKARTKFLPNVPTSVEVGLPDFQMVQWFGLFAPAGTPAPVVSKISAAMQTVLADRDALGRVSDLSVQPGAMNAGEFSRFVHDQYAAYEKIVKSLDLKIE